MKPVKIIRFVFLMACPLLAISCSDSDDVGSEPPIWVQSYVMNYVDGDLAVLKTAAAKKWYIGFESKSLRFYYCPEMVVQPQTHEKFRQLAAANGDNGYNDYVPFLHQFESCFADNFRQIRITSDTDWDAAHPAGEPLDDLAMVGAASFAPFVRNGYERIPDGRLLTDKVWICKRLCDLAPDDLQMVIYSHDSGIAFWFVTPPEHASQPQTLTIRLVTADGTTREVSVTGIPPVIR